MKGRHSRADSADEDAEAGEGLLGEAEPAPKPELAKKAMERQAGLTVSNVLVSLILMCLSCAYALSATLSKNTDGSYPYQTVLVPLLAEALKAAISFVSLVFELRALSPAERQARVPWSYGSLLMAGVPGVGYQVLNNLQFVTLYFLDMPTYQILANLKIIATGLAGHWMLNRKLAQGQWLGLALLAFGAAVTQLAHICDDKDTAVVDVRGYISAMVCVCLSAIIGVFTEKFMKSEQCSIHWQNFQLYIWGVFSNIVVLLWTSNMMATTASPDSASPDSSSKGLSMEGFNFAAWCAVVSLSLTGLAVSFLLRFADSIVKTYATVLSAPFSAIVAYAVLGSHIGVEHIVGLGVMVISFAYYYGGASLFVPPP